MALGVIATTVGAVTLGMKVVEIFVALKPIVKPVFKATAYLTIAALIVILLSGKLEV